MYWNIHLCIYTCFSAFVGFIVRIQMKVFIRMTQRTQGLYCCRQMQLDRCFLQTICEIIQIFYQSFNSMTCLSARAPTCRGVISKWIPLLVTPNSHINSIEIYSIEIWNSKFTGGSEYETCGLLGWYCVLWSKFIDISEVRIYSIDREENESSSSSIVCNFGQLCQTIKHHMPADSSLHNTVA